MKITQADIASAQVTPITDWAKDMCWGKQPFPDAFIPILAVTSIGNPVYGILMRSKTSGRFVIGTSGALRNLNNNFALTLMSKAHVDDTWECGSWGGAREGAGRPKEVPEEAKRRSIFMTNDEFEFVKDWLKKSREGK